MTRILVVGAGKMGEAIIAGWISASVGPACDIDASCITAVAPSSERRAYLSATYNVACIADACEAQAADIVILSVKPKVMPSVLEAIAQNPALVAGPSGPLFVSIAAGISTSAIEAALGEGARVVRVMPNTPLMVCAGASGVCAGAHVSPEEVAYMRDLFACMGQAVVVEERDMDVVCGLSGSGPAYIDALIEALRDGAVAQGLNAELAEMLAIQTVYGAAKLLMETGNSPEQARIAVCTPGGTTVAGLEAMAQAGFAESVAAGVAAATRRSKELGA